MTAVACTGAGKSALALAIAHNEMAMGRCSLIVIVVPTRQLKRQWARTAYRAGVTLTSCWVNGVSVVPEGVHGVIVTYSQLARLPEAVRLLCGRYRVLGIMDEVHHGGDGLSWGDGLREGLEAAVARLCLSGTPFRTDQLRLPFVRYDDRGRAVGDVRYPIAQALADGVVRPVFFHAFGGKFHWRDGGGLHQATFSDQMGEIGRARRLRVALDPAGDWLPHVLRQADMALKGTRSTHPRAKAFVVCTDACHAREVAALLTVITGEAPTLALSDDPGSAEALDRFRRDTAAWLVVCRLAGEGFDCPDLRCCVWASVVCAELYFRQVIGRVIRVVDGLPYQDAAVFLPADPRLVRLAEEFLDEPAAAPGQCNEGHMWAVRGGFGDGDFRPLSSEATETEIITGGELIPAEMLCDARDLKESRPYLDHLPIHFIASLLTAVENGAQDFEDVGLSAPAAAQLPLRPDTALGAGGEHARQLASPVEVGLAAEGADGAGSEADDDVETYDEKMARLRQNCGLLTAQIARELGTPVTGIHRFYREHLGFGQANATLAQLEAKHALLRQKADELRAAADQDFADSQGMPG